MKRKNKPPVFFTSSFQQLEISMISPQRHYTFQLYQQITPRQSSGLGDKLNFSLQGANPIIPHHAAFEKNLPSFREPGHQAKLENKVSNVAQQRNAGFRRTRVCHSERPPIRTRTWTCLTGTTPHHNARQRNDDRRHAQPAGPLLALPPRSSAPNWQTARHLPCSGPPNCHAISEYKGEEKIKK
jgi:hypothetical protein